MPKYVYDVCIDNQYCTTYQTVNKARAAAYNALLRGASVQMRKRWPGAGTRPSPTHFDRLNYRSFLPGLRISKMSHKHMLKAGDTP